MFFDDQRSNSGQDWLFGALQTFARGRAVARGSFQEQRAGFTAIRKLLPHQSLLLWEVKLVWKTIDTDITLD